MDRRQDLAYLGCSASVGVFSGFTTFCVALWLATGFTTSYLVIGLIGNSRSLIGAIVSPLAGAWSDRIWLPLLGRRQPFILVGGLMAALLLALTPTISQWRLGPLPGPLPDEVQRLAPMALAMLLVTVAFNAMDDIHKALLVDVVPEDGRNRLAARALLTEMAGQLGILLVGFLVWQQAVPDSAFPIAGALIAAGVLVTVAGVREPVPVATPAIADPGPKSRSRQPLVRRYPAAAAFFLSSFAFGFGLSAVLPLISLYTRDILGASVGEAQLLPALLFLALALLALPMGQLADRLGKRRVISGGYLLLLLASLAGLVITTQEQGAAVFILAGAGSAAVLAPRIPLLAELVPAAHMGAATGLLAAAGSVASPVGTLVSAASSDLFGPRAIFAVMAAMVALGIAAMPMTRQRLLPVTSSQTPAPSRGRSMHEHLYDLVRQRASSYPDAVALGSQQGLSWRSIDSRELLARVDGLAEELAARGVQAGDRVVLWLPNHWRAVVFHFALWKLGAIVVPFDREMNPEAGAHIIGSVEPRLIVTGYGERPTWARDADLTEWWEPSSSSDPPSWEPPQEELAMVVFTSGTTGQPKGCMISHSNLCSQIAVLHESIPLDPSCRLASVLPLSHLFELTCGMLYPLAQGAAIHYAPSRRGPDIVRVLQEQRVTHMIAVPQLLSLMGQALEDQLRRTLPGPVRSVLRAAASRMPLDARRRLFFPVHRKLGGHLRMMAAGGAALAPETQLLWEGLGIRVVQGYGTSECSPVVACGSGDGSAPVGSVGRPLPGVEVRLAADGELLVHGPNVMRGYWKDPGHTAEVLHDGWYSTGDLARIDEEGNLWITGRARDLIVLPSGMNLWPQDVEEVLRAHEAVKDAAVIPVPTPSGGLTLHAHVIPAGLGADLNAVIASCNTRLAPHQRVATASWWPEADFPRTSTLKVRRALLPQPEGAGTVKLDGLRTDDDPVGQAVAGIARTGAVRGDQTLAELGLDSLGMVELAVSLEAKTGKLVGDGDLQLPMTVQQIRDLLATAPELDGAGTGHSASSEPPMWPYTWGRALRPLAAPITLLYRCAVTHTTILGREHLGGLGHPVIFAGTHHGFADMSLVHHGLAHSPARHLARRLVAATAATELEIGRVRIGGLGLGGWYGILAFGLFPLQRTRGQEASLRQLARIGEAGNAILIFPQGAHARPQQERDGDPLARFRPGVAHLAAALSARVVPFGVAGTDLIIPPMREDFHGPVIAGVPVSITRGPLAIAFGAPLSLQPGETPDAFTARLQDESYRLTRLAEEALTPRGIPSRAKG